MSEYTETSFKNEKVEIWLENEILFFKYSKGVKIDLELAQTVVKERLRISRYSERPCLIDGSVVEGMKREARIYFSSDEATHLISVAALVVNNPVQKFLANVLKAINSTKVRTKIFTNIDKALLWIKSDKEDISQL